MNSKSNPPHPLLHVKPGEVSGQTGLHIVFSRPLADHPGLPWLVNTLLTSRVIKRLVVEEIPANQIEKTASGLRGHERMLYGRITLSYSKSPDGNDHDIASLASYLAEKMNRPLSKPISVEVAVQAIFDYVSREMSAEGRVPRLLG